MFKSLKYKSDIYQAKTYKRVYTFTIVDDDFTVDSIIEVSAKDGTEAGSIAAGCIIQEYSTRKLNVPKNLALWYMTMYSDSKDRVLVYLAKDKKYIDDYFSSLKFNKALYDETIKALEKKIKEQNATTV